MNKNTLLAIALILAVVALFSSPGYQRFYITKILKQPYTNQPVDSGNTVETRKETGATAEKSRSDSSAFGIIDKEKKDTISAVKTDTGTVKTDTLWVETETMIAGISDQGARIVSLKMKKYRIDHSRSESTNIDNSPMVDLVPKNSEGGCGLALNNAVYDRNIFQLESSGTEKRIGLKKGDSTDLSFLYRDDSGNEIRKKYSFHGDGYKIGLTVISNQLNNNRLTVSWLCGISESENEKGSFNQSEERKAHYFDGQNVQHVKNNKSSKEDVSGFFRWVGVSSKYFFIALCADTSKDADIKIISKEEIKTEEENGKKKKIKPINYAFSYQFTGQGNEARFLIYSGPSQYKELKEKKLGFEKILFPVLGWTKVFFWADKWFPPVAEFVLWLMLLLYRLVKDYGIAIVILTVLSRLVTYPLTQSSIKSMNRMKDIQPKINTLRQKYKSNPQKMNTEIMALYKAEGVNPLNPGCLPMFLQMPVFIALFVVLQKAIELRGAATIITPWIKDLSRPESVFSFESLLPGGIPLYGSNFAVLPIIMAILTFFQNKMTIKDPNQKMMIYFMPLFMLFLFNNFPSGLVLYWTLSSALGLAQQFYTEKQQAKNIQTVSANKR